jgi:hypothetical protein
VAGDSACRRRHRVAALEADVDTWAVGASSGETVRENT